MTTSKISMVLEGLTTEEFGTFMLAFTKMVKGLPGGRLRTLLLNDLLRVTDAYQQAKFVGDGLVKIQVGPGTARAEMEDGL